MKNEKWYNDTIKNGGNEPKKDKSFEQKSNLSTNVSTSEKGVFYFPFFYLWQCFYSFHKSATMQSLIDFYGISSFITIKTEGEIIFDTHIEIRSIMENTTSSSILSNLQYFW